MKAASLVRLTSGCRGVKSMPSVLRRSAQSARTRHARFYALAHAPSLHRVKSLGCKPLFMAALTNPAWGSRRTLLQLLLQPAQFLFSSQMPLAPSLAHLPPHLSGVLFLPYLIVGRRTGLLPTERYPQTPPIGIYGLLSQMPILGDLPGGYLAAFAS